MSPNTHHSNGDPPEDRATKNLALTIAVIVSMLFIVAAWLFFLPYQLRQASLLEGNEQTRWQETQDGVRADTKSFQETLDSLQDNFAELEESVDLQEASQSEETSNGRVPPEVIEQLRQKLSELELQAKESGSDDEQSNEPADSEIQSE